MGTRQSEQRVRGDFAQVIKTFGNSLAERTGFEPAVPSALTHRDDLLTVY